MIEQNKYTKAISWELPPKKFVFTTCFQFYFLTNEITRVHDWGAYFIEYVFEFYFLSILRFKGLNTTVRPKLDSPI